MDSDLRAWAHPVRAQLVVEELELKLGIRTDTTTDDSALLDFADEPREPPD